MTISTLLDAPLYEATGLSADVPFRLPVAIDGRAYQIDVAKYTRQHLPGLRPTNDTTAEAGESALSSIGAWRRHQFDWTGGAGQEFFDAESPNAGQTFGGQFISDRTRFWKSYGIDCWTKGQLSRIPNASLSAMVGTGIGKLLTVGTYVYALEGVGTLRRYAFDVFGALAATSITGTPADMTDITTDGYNVWISSTANGVYKTNTGTAAASNVSANNGDLIRYANGRLLLGTNGTSPTLKEVDAAGAVVTTFTNPVAGTITWKDIAGGPGKIYVSISVSGQGSIYRINLNESTGSLQTALVSATQLPTGEYCNALLFYGGVACLGTNKGLRLANISSTGGLEYGPAITAPGEILSLVADDRFVWFTWSNYVYGDYPVGFPALTPTRTGTGRADLSNFTNTLTPAYAFDLFYQMTATVTSVTRLSNKTVFAAGGYVAYTGTTYPTLVALNSGKMRFGVFLPKNAVNVDFRHDKINIGGIGVGASASYGWAVSVGADDEDIGFGFLNTHAGINLVEGSVGPPAPFSLIGKKGEALQVEMYGAGPTDSSLPPLRRWSLVASPAPHRQEQIQVAIILRGDVFDENGPDDGQVYQQDVEFELNHLRVLAESGEIVPYQEGGQVWNVIVIGVEQQPVQWNDDRKSIEGTALVTLITV